MKVSLLTALYGEALPRDGVRANLPLLWLGGNEGHVRRSHEPLLSGVREASPIQGPIQAEVNGSGQIERVRR